MKRPSGRGGKPGKLRRRTAPKPQQRRPKPPDVTPSPDDGENDEVVRLRRELNEAVERQTATSEVLRVVSSFPGDLVPVFNAMLANATWLCGADYGTLWLHESDGDMRMAALHGSLPNAFRENWRVGRTFKPSRSVPAARAFTTQRLVHVVDLREDQSYIDGDALAVSSVELAGIRSLMAVPLVKEDTPLGAMTLYRREVRPFTEKQIELVQNFAAQAVIAIENARLLNQLHQRTNDLTEALEQQTATSEVLGVISSSPGELEPVFAAILASATRICEAEFGNLFLRDEDAFCAVAWHGVPTYMNTWQGPALTIKTDIGDIPLARLAATQQRVHVADLRQEPAYKRGHEPLVALVDKGGARTLLIVPMLNDRTLVGAIAIYRQEVRPFRHKQVELVENFAAQAVIAIENARLLNELRQRTTDLSEALEQQTATSDVLSIISSSPSDLRPIFQAILENATRICEAGFGFIHRYDGELFEPTAQAGAPTELVEFHRKRGSFRPDVGGMLDRMIRTKEVGHTSDIAAETFPVAAAKIAGARSTMAVPMLKDDVLVGALVIYRQEVRPFTDKQISLVANFAKQAVIAIENARLLNELRQSLEQQTATSEVLQVISSSPAILNRCLRPCLRMRCASVKPSLATSIVPRATACVTSLRRTRRPLSRRCSGVRHILIPAQKTPCVA